MCADATHAATVVARIDPGAIARPRFTALPPLALYVHIPWCISKCPYCDFNSHAAPEALPEDAFNRKVMGDPEVAKRIQFQAPITDAQREAYLALWWQLKVDVK